jgi:hypothetical protein
MSAPPHDVGMRTPARCNTCTCIHTFCSHRGQFDSQHTLSPHRVSCSMLVPRKFIMVAEIGRKKDGLCFVFGVSVSALAHNGRTCNDPIRRAGSDSAPPLWQLFYCMLTLFFFFFFLIFVWLYWLLFSFHGIQRMQGHEVEKQAFANNRPPSPTRPHTRPRQPGPAHTARQRNVRTQSNKEKPPSRASSSSSTTFLASSFLGAAAEAAGAEPAEAPPEGAEPILALPAEFVGSRHTTPK